MYAQGCRIGKIPKEASGRAFFGARRYRAVHNEFYPFLIARTMSR